MKAAIKRVGTRLSDKTLRFIFDGREYEAQVGDTAASALMAHGIFALGRSVKYRRLRGLLAVGPEEPNALLTVGVTPMVIPNVSAPQLQLREGLVLKSQNRWPSLRFDVASLLQLGSGFFGAGFYYKTFMWPSWRTYESLIRRLAGLGEAPGASDLPVAAVEYLSCDVLVAGAGAAGLSAALVAAHTGARVVLVEREPVLGGELEFESALVDGQPATSWVTATEQMLQTLGVRILTDTTLVGGTGGVHIAHHEPGGLAGHNKVFHIRSRVLVIAMGAIERPIALINNDLPGVMLLGAAERLSRRYGALTGRRAVIFANHQRAYAAAARLVKAGVSVRAVIDTRSAAVLEQDAVTARHCASLQVAGVLCLSESAVVSAKGWRTVTGVDIQHLRSGKAKRIACDLLLTSGGWSPAMHAGLQGGGTTRYAADKATFTVTDQPIGRVTVGASSGHFELAAVLSEAASVTARVMSELGLVSDGAGIPMGLGDPAPRLAPYWRAPCTPSQEKRQFIDFQNDVTVADLRASLAEGFRDIEHVKRYATLGIGTEQGRTSTVLGAAILAELKGESIESVGLSRPRPPYHPMTMRAMAGLRVGSALRVAKRTPLHDWHVSHGGVLDPMGLWMRPRFYRSNGADAAIAAVTEARRVRTTGGIVDGSTLGKIEVVGADVAAFLDSMYLTKASTIKIGRSKYMVNLREDGMVLDDGIVLRLAADRFIATTSSGHAEHMLSHFEHYREMDWPGRAVTLTDITDAWSVIAVAGPRSRAAIQHVLGSEWQSRIETLTHMDFAQGHYAGVALTVLRASFSGELAYELHVGPAAAVALWEALVTSGLEPYGIDALDILRVEKGYLVSSELNGQTTPGDLNMDSLVRLGNPCVGRALLDRPAFHEPTRGRLVGVRAVDGCSGFLAGAQLTTLSSTQPLGYITSSVFSPTLNEWIGLALLARAQAIEGATLIARDPLRGQETPVRVTSTVHVDPTGERIKS
jgi:sarcosine oxidase subunit alpha